GGAFNPRVAAASSSSGAGIPTCFASNAAIQPTRARNNPALQGFDARWFVIQKAPAADNVIPSRVQNVHHVRGNHIATIRLRKAPKPKPRRRGNQPEAVAATTGSSTVSNGRMRKVRFHVSARFKLGWPKRSGVHRLRLRKFPGAVGETIF